MEPHRIALLGAGDFATDAHLPAIAATETIHLAAVYSRSLLSANSFIQATQKHASTSHDITVYSDDPSTEKLDALLARSDIQTVVLALPITSQPAVIERAWRAGKNVISEKPVAPSIEEAKGLLGLFEKEFKPKGILWIVAEQMPYIPSFAKARNFIRNGKIGQLRSFHAEVHIQPSVEAAKTGWRAVPDYQGGFLLDGGVHFAGALRHILPYPLTSIFAHSSQIQPHLPPCDTLIGLLTATPPSLPSQPGHDNAPTAIAGTFHFTFGIEKPSSTLLYTFRGSTGVMTVDFSGARDHVLKLVSLPRGELGEEAEEEEEEDPHELTVELPSGGVPDEYEAFGRALIAGAGSQEARFVEERSGPRATLRDLAFIEGGLKSSEERREVDFEEVLGEFWEI
ncbi:hypothetical protein JCM11641_005735 [Rhodosporidiobolus odoratus]